MSEGTVVEIHPDAQKFAYLKSGLYGPNTPNPADCEIVKYEFPAKTLPGYDKEGRKEDYVFIQIRVSQIDGPAVMSFDHIKVAEYSRCPLPNWLLSLGVPCEGEKMTHNTNQVIGLKCAAEYGDPWEGNRGWNTGKLINIIGL